MKRIQQITIALVLAVTTSAWATEGINLIGIGPVQQGTAGAGVASPKDSTWVTLNPAGITDLKPGLDASIQYFQPDRSINSTANPGAGKESDDSAFYIPSISATFGGENGGKDFFGVALYGSSGMGVDYDQPRVGFSSGDTDTELSIAKLIFTYAHAFDNGLSVGVGPVLVLGRFKTDMETSRTGPPSAASNGDWDDATGAGAIIGVNQKVTDRLNIGASYISEQFMSDYNDYGTLFPKSLNLPQQVTIGLAYDVLDELEVVLDYRWIGWGQLDTFGDQFGWEDQNIVKAGLTWDATEKLIVRGGISHGNSPIGTEDVFANALFPAIMKTHLTAGASYQFDRWALHAAYIHGVKEDITASGAPEAGGGTTISMVQNSATLGASWSF